MKLQTDERFKKISLPPQNSHFAALAPTWAGIHSEDQLRGMLVMASLFNDVVYLHDSQLGDNPHLLHSFQLRKDRKNNLFNLLACLINNKVVHIGLRDSTYLPAKDKFIPCSSLIDVYHSWQQQHIPGAWIIPEKDNSRLSYLKTLDKSLESAYVHQYPYAEVKKGFMERVRLAISSKNASHYNNFIKLPYKLRSQYLEVLGRDWFSYSELLKVLSEYKIDVHHPFLQIHGLFDEASFASWNNARLFGNDSYFDAEQVLFDDTNVAAPHPQDTHEAHFNVIANAIRSIDAPGLSLLSTLSANEILELREDAKGLFSVLSFYNFKNGNIDINQFKNAYIDAVADYWDKICSHLSKSRPYLTSRRTKIGIFTRDQLPTFSKFLSKHVSLTVNVGLDLLMCLLPFKNDISKETRKSVVDSLSFKFIFFTNNPHFKSVKSAMPNKIWISRDHSTLGEKA